MRTRKRPLCERVWPKRRPRWNWGWDVAMTSLLCSGCLSINTWMGFCFAGVVVIWLFIRRRLGEVGVVVDSQLHPKGGSLSFSELNQLLTQTLNERFLFLRLQNQKQGHNAVHNTLHIYKHRKKRIFSTTCQHPFQPDISMSICLLNPVYIIILSSEKCI